MVHSAPIGEATGRPEDETYSVTVYDHPSRPDGTVIADIPARVNDVLNRDSQQRILLASRPV